MPARAKRFLSSATWPSTRSPGSTLSFASGWAVRMPAPWGAAAAAHATVLAYGPRSWPRRADPLEASSP